MNEIPLGRATQYPASYSPELLFSIPRRENRERLGITGSALPFRGYDLWRAYEISWLDDKGKPVVATGEFIVPASTPNIIESKSFKLYLNSLNQTRYENSEQVRATLSKDLSKAAGGTVVVQLVPLHQPEGFAISSPPGTCLDSLDVTIDSYQPNLALLQVIAGRVVEETLYSNLFRSNCPVTAQPDWGTAVIQYKGPAIAHESLLRYLVSFREHEGFHEDCTEQVFCDLQKQCQPESLSVMIHFLRRGGLEINPVRSMAPVQVDFPANRFVRQ